MEEVQFQGLTTEVIKDCPMLATRLFSVVGLFWAEHLGECYPTPTVALKNQREVSARPELPLVLEVDFQRKTCSLSSLLRGANQSLVWMPTILPSTGEPYRKPRIKKDRHKHWNNVVAATSGVD